MTARAPGYKSVVTTMPIYYGWVVWFVALVGTAASSPGQSYSVSLFMDYFIADFGLDRTTVSSLYGLGTFIASFGLTWLGRKLDLAGNRRTGVVIGFLFGLVLCLCAFINGPVMLLVAFIGIRGLGQGALCLVSSTAVANWFRSRRGRMMAYLALAYALFQGLYVNGLRVLLDSLDWRVAFIVLGLGVSALVAPLFGFLMRNRPEEYGLLPDNQSRSAAAKRSAPLTQNCKPSRRLSDAVCINSAKRDAKAQDQSIAAADNEENWTLREAMRTPVLWLYMFARMLPSAWGTGLVLHQVSIFAQLDHSAQVATETFALLSIFAAASALLAGYLIDRFKPSIVVVLAMMGLAGACLLAMIMRDTALLVLYALASGLGLGIGYVFDGAVWTNMFGRRFQGEIRGFVFTAGIIGSAIGPALFGLSFDYAGGYGPALALGALLAIVVMALALVTPQPRRR
ncbi:MAG: MFS transporter [Chloroflexi bacterium]|nr:MFS transporter [Chloroflexota bacterium]